jgi:hypothetical protein
MVPGAKRRGVSSSAETCQDLLPDPNFNFQSNFVAAYVKDCEFSDLIGLREILAQLESLLLSVVDV